MLQRGSTPLRRRQQKRCPLHIPAAVRACACSRRAGCTLPEAFSQMCGQNTRKFKVGARMVSLGLRRCCPASTQRLHQLRRLSILQELLDVERLLPHRAGAALGQAGDVKTEVRHVPRAGRSSTGNLRAGSWPGPTSPGCSAQPACASGNHTPVFGCTQVRDVVGLGNVWHPPMAGSIACSRWQTHNAASQQIRLPAGGTARRTMQMRHCMQQLPRPASRTCTASPGCRLQCSQAGVLAQQFSTWQWRAVEMGCTAGLRRPPGIMPSTSCRNCKGYQRAVKCKPAQRPNWLWALLGSSAQ